MNHGSIHHVVVYFGLSAIGSGGIKPCTSTFGADQFDTNDPMKIVLQSQMTGIQGSNDKMMKF
jgi:peptide/histidine transporter 3/4